MPETREERRSVRGLLVAGAIVLAVVIGAAAGLAAMDRAPAGIPADGVIFGIEHGENLGAISARLEEQGLIRSGFLLRVLARVKGTGQSFKAGYYRIRPSYDTLAVHDLLVQGRQDQVSVTLPEGWTSSRIASYLEAKQVTDKDGFLKAVASAELRTKFGIPGQSLEGYLFPDTYYLSQNMPAELIVSEMVTNFFRKLESMDPEYQARGARALHEAVILASIVEREYRVPEEAPYIASVFTNRLARGIGLESCATVAYIITEIQGKPYPQYLTKDDLAINSPFNTYKWAGYPPAPISNPGITALGAALHPAKTDYFYFVLRDADAGSHYFSRDLEEHNRAKSFYLKGIGAGS
jgi:UPF0755 protein